MVAFRISPEQGPAIFGHRFTTEKLPAFEGQLIHPIHQREGEWIV